MKSQISRHSFRPEAHYSGVYLQQGRMILDADWNELTDIHKARLVQALRDAIAGGAPRVGGLGLFADPAGSGNIRIRPGVLYVEGVPARLEAPAPLTPDAQPDYPLQAPYDGRNLRFYADVWERTITALEQPGLLDAALHGADTTTRTQTLLQVKRCPDTLDPLDSTANPPMGDAPLSVKLRLIASSGDACDPCAAQVKVDERIGNYMFRVEVHDYDAASRKLTLKWSRDNGAEACATADMPAGFDQGDWVWEFYDQDTERLLGNHFVTGAGKLHGFIRDSYQVPAGAGQPKSYARQWDGYLVIDLDDGSLGGRDRGVDLAAGAVGDQSHGRVHLDGAGLLRVNLELTELELATDGRAFVPGDHWLAEVREARDSSGDTVLDAAPPIGVRHHYLYLGAVGANRKLVAENDAFARRMAFPPLSDLRAADVGFTDNCPGLFSGAENLQQALDNLCAIGAEDIGYALPDCGPDEGSAVKNRLQAELDPNSDGQLTVQVALDTLLCRLDAAVLPLDKGDADLCSDLQVPAVETVQDALKLLCDRPGAGGCPVAASSPAHLHALLKQFAADGDARDLWICLRAGSYPLDDLPPISGKRSLRITGAGAGSVALISKTGLSLGADQVILEGFSLTFTAGSSQLSITAGQAQMHGCRCSRSNKQLGPAMIQVGASDGGECRMSWRDSRLHAQIRQVQGNGSTWAGRNVVGNVKTSQALLALGNDALLDDKFAYDEAMKTAVEQVMALSLQQRRRWMTRLVRSDVNARRGTSILTARVPQAESASLVRLLGKSKMNFAETLQAVENLVAQWVTYSPDLALRLESHKVGGTVADCELDGWLLLGNGVDGHAGLAGIKGVHKAAWPPVLPGGGELELRGSRITAVKANLPADAQDTGQMLQKRLDGHARLTLSANHFEDPDNLFTAANLMAQGNQWAGGNAGLGYAVVSHASFTGNLADNEEGVSQLLATTLDNRIAEGGNLMFRVDSLPVA